MIDVLQHAWLQIDMFIDTYLYREKRGSWQDSGGSKFADNVSGLKVNNRKERVMITDFIFPYLKNAIGKYEMI